ncbi:Receptor-like serine/threonine-protein kinase SD1-8 [Citrus sinensis]|uniref:Receptor-like serine/threonine-protein kinase SD1-8 n=1 Tax=Citrus sinensis TaxID=2711 RepID=A0ACB8NXY1_CITSI|nr:Receptor-like serine/threonine-protein kinase SD1-8 [Citrus sinensis]
MYFRFRSSVVANRINPINDSSGLLVVNETGNLVLTSQNKSVVWSANLSKEVRTPVVLQLLDSGNLVLRGERDCGSEIYLWQSFDYPSDTLLPGIKLGWDLKTGLERRITSWKSPDDPFPGNFIWALERQDNPESIFWKGSKKLTRSGPWNGLRFSASSLRQNPDFNFSFVSNEDELYYTFDLIDKAVFSRMVMNQTLYLRQRFIWNKATKSWDLNVNVPRDLCFKLKSRGYVDWSQGCVRDKSLNYSRQDGFIKFTAMKLPDATLSWVSKSMNLNECREKCIDNSSCMAYTNSDIRGEGSGCAMWFGELIDMRDFADGGQDLYIRMSASELVDQGAKGEPRTEIVVIVISTAALLAVVIAAGHLVHKRRRNIVEKTENNRETNEVQNMDLELPLFELATIANATDNFSINNKLGERGFGPVYKGTLVDGQEIAVKRLSKISEQGLEELNNEVILFSKLQHRNLVKLLGCCIQGEETLLIYEFMPNKSLNSFIFGPDQEKCKILDWSKRFHIICGTARGLLYLHQDSRLRIIHRDLKAKYASDGQFSIKSDVFSFGILLLKTISGKKNRGFYHSDKKLNLIGHAKHALSDFDVGQRDCVASAKATRLLGGQEIYQTRLFIKHA